MSLKKILSIIISIQLSLMPLKYAHADYDNDGPSFDFSDEPFVISPGEDTRGEGAGNCTGSACDEREGNGEGYDGRDDQGDHGSGNDFGHEGGEADDSRDHDEYDNGSSSNESRTNENSEKGAKIEVSPRDRGDGVVFARDIKGNIYYQGEPSYLVIDESQDYYTDDHTDIYYNKSGSEFVISTDKKTLLPIDNLKNCAISNSCKDLGYREDWWNYSTSPTQENTEESGDWWEIEDFFKTSLRIEKAIEHGRNSSTVKNDPGKLLVLNEAAYLNHESKKAYGRYDKKEALALQEGAIQLASAIVDIGISISPLGWAKDAYELITGKSLVTGKQLTQGERTLAAIGVTLPGVAALAFAGLKIAARNPLVKTAVNTSVHQLGILTEALAGLKIERIHLGKDASTVVIIGRDMASVKIAAESISTTGINVKIFNPSDMSILDMSKRVAENNKKFLDYRTVPDSLMYKENMNWIKCRMEDGATFVNIGNPSKNPIPSAFYDGERELIKNYGTQYE